MSVNVNGDNVQMVNSMTGTGQEKVSTSGTHHVKCSILLLDEVLDDSEYHKDNTYLYFSLTMHSLSDYDYILPKKLIAQQAVNPPDSCKFLIYNEKENKDHFLDEIFSSLPEKVETNSLIVFNTTKVVKARIPLVVDGKK